MVTRTKPKTQGGYWRTNPYTGEQDWIEQPVTSAPKLEKETLEPTIWGVDVTGKAVPKGSREDITSQPIKPLPSPTELPEFNIKELAGLYNIPEIYFVPSEELKDLALPPEERAVQWQIPYEQYLTWEQAKYLGFDVPEGSVIKMTPTIEGEPTFTLMPEVGRIPQIEPALTATLRIVYPEMFDPRNSYGFSPEQLPAVVAEQLGLQMQEDYQGFVDDLYRRVGEVEAERILKQFGVTEEFILAGLSYEKQEERIINSIQEVFPEFKDIETFDKFYREDTALFIETMQTGGSSLEKRRLLEEMGYNPDEINQIFSVQRLVLPIDGVRKLITVDINSMRAYDQMGNWIGSYNPVTREYSSLPEESWLKDFVDSWRYAGASFIHTEKQFFTTTLPNLLFRDSWAWEKKLFGKEHTDKVDAFNKSLREYNRKVFAKNNRDFDDYLTKHSDIAPKPLRADVFEDWKDPTYWFYQFAQSSAFMGSILATEAAVLILTRNPALALTAGGALTATIQTEEAKNALLEAGATDDQAEQWGVGVGALTALIEVGGDIPYLKILAPTILRAFRKEAAKEISEQLVKNMAKSGVKTFTKTSALVTFTETMEEDAQLITTNAAKKVFDENQGLFEGLGRTTIEATITMLPFGTLGGAMASFHRISPSQTQGLSDAQMKARGWVKDAKTGNWYERLKEAIRDETGAIILPGEPEEVIPVTPEVTKPQITQQVIDTASKTQIEQTTMAGRVRKVNPENVRQVEGYLLAEETERLAGGNFRNIYVWKEGRWSYVEGKSGARVYSKADTNRVISNLKLEEKLVTPTAPAVEIPKAEVLPAQTWTEAGIQPSMLPEDIAAIEVRPPSKGKITQISMDDQMKLQQAKEAAEEASPEEQEAYQAQWEIEGLRAVHQVDPVVRWRTEITTSRKTKQPDGSYKLTQYQRRVGLDSFIPIGQTEFPDTLTVKQARMIWPGADYSRWLQEGTREYNKVPQDVALDPIASELGFTGTTAVKDLVARINQIRKEKRQLKEAELTIGREMAEKPVQLEKETKDIGDLIKIRGEPLYTIDQIDALSGIIGEYLVNPNIINVYKTVRQYQALERARRFKSVASRREELIVTEGLSWEEAHNKAMDEFASGKLPSLTIEYLKDVTAELRDVFFAKVHHTFDQLGSRYEGERWAAITALTNALAGKPIPMDKGKGSLLFPEGGSAWDRLNYVFGKQPRLMEGLTKTAEQKKSLEDVVEGIFREVPEGGFAPIPIDQEMADYLRNLSLLYDRIKLWEQPTELQFQIMEDVENLPSGLKVEDARTEVEKIIEMRRKGLLPAPPVAKFDPPIEKAFKQPVLKDWPIRERMAIVRVLKGVGWGAVDIFNFLRALKTTLDNSFLRQGKVLAAGHPLVAFKAHNTSWRMMFSQSVAEERWELITRKPWFPGYEERRIKTGHDPLRLPAFAARKGTAQYRTAEEFGFPTVERWIPRMTAKLPIIKPFERAFSGGTNEIVAGIMDIKWAQTLRQAERIASGEITLKVGEAFDIEQEMTAHQGFLADLIQRATLPERARGLAPVFNAFFFALRSKLGRFLMPTHLLGMTRTGKKIGFNPRIMKEAWKDFILFNAEMGGIMFLGSWLGLWDLEDDPRNAEFMSARIGNTRLDPWAGYRQFVVLYARLVTGTGISSVTGAEYEVNPKGAVQSFIENSLSPGASILLEFWTGRNFLGQVIDFADKKYWVEKITAMSLWDIWEAFEDAGWGRAAQMLIPAIYGEGVQTYTGDWVENFTKLGLPKYLENTAYGITEPRYDTADFWTDTSSQFKGVDPATLTKEKGYPEYIRAIVESNLVKEHLDTLPSERLVSINTDPAKGLTFADYFNQWKQREKLVADGEKAEWTRRELQPDGKYKEVTYKGDEALRIFDQDERTRNANMGNFSQRQFALLNEYWSITDKKKQAEFLKQHEAEIGTDLRQDYLRTHPKENAQLAVWGQAKILTKEAYNQFLGLVKALDIPDSAIPELTLPPEGSVENYFKYQEMDNKNNWEVQLMLAQDDDLRIFLDRLPIDTPIASLELKVKNRANFDKLDAFSDVDSPDYITDEKERAEAIKQFKADNPEFVDDARRIEAIEKGTDEAPIDEALVNAHVAYMRMQDAEGVGSSSAEVMLYRVDNLGYNAFRMDNALWGDQALTPIDQSRIPIWRIDVLYRKEDAEYDALPVDGTARADYLAENEDYRKDRRRREAYQKGLTQWVDDYVSYYELPITGYRRDRILFNNPDFANALGLKIPGRVPSEQYDILLENEDRTPEDELRMDAYKLYMPDDQIEDYVGYKTIPAGPYEDDWFLMEHPEFYQQVYLSILGNQRKDYRLVPSRKVYAKYLIYRDELFSDRERKEYRLANLDLDEWGQIAFGWVSIKEWRRKEELSPSEDLAEEVAERLRKVEELLVG